MKHISDNLRDILDPEWRQREEENWKKLIDTVPLKSDIVDIIAGELKISRARAYDLMREALNEAEEE